MNIKNRTVIGDIDDQCARCQRNQVCQRRDFPVRFKICLEGENAGLIFNRGDKIVFNTLTFASTSSLIKINSSLTIAQMLIK